MINRSFRISEEVLDWLEEKAVKEKRSVNNALNATLEELVEKEQKKKKSKPETE